jgi:TonB-dependent receptor
MWGVVMNLREMSCFLLGGCALVALSPAFAETSADFETVVVSASRFEDQARLQQRAALNIVNVQSAETMLKFPDVNAAESLSRIPGIALMSDTGEGRFVMIRGIDGNLNGTTYGGVVLLNTDPGGTYQGGGGRAVELDTIPGGAIDGIIVTKTGSPDHDAEGLGGTVELTPRTAANITEPFVDLSAGYGLEPAHDHGGPFNADIAIGGRFGIENGAIVMERGQSVGRVNPGFVSNPTPFSIVLDASWREDKRGFDDIEEDYINNPANPTSAAAKVYDDLQLRFYDAHRKRFGVGGEFDFTPNDEHRWYIRGNMFGYDEAIIKHHLIFNALGGDYPTTIAGNKVSTSSDLTIKGTDVDQIVRNNVYAVGGEDDFHAFKLDYRVSYSRATLSTGRNYGTTFKGPTVVVTYDNIDSPNFPAMAVTDGTDINDPSLYKLSKFSNKKAKGADEEWAYGANVAVPVDFLSDKDEIKVGFSARLRDKTFYESPQSISLPKSKPVLAALSPLAADTSFYHGRYTNGPGLNMPALEALSTITYGGFSVDNSTWFDADENIYAGYAMYTGEAGPWGVLAGVRVENTVAKYAFYDADSNGDNTVYTRMRHDYVDVFPTVQVRYSFADDLQARATYSTGIGRPGFAQVALGTSVNSDNNTITMGNPTLKPVTGSNFDLDIEYYLEDGGIIELGAFDKEFQNYIYTSSMTVAGDPRLPGATPVKLISYGNLDNSYARGLEFAYQQKFTFLPKPLDGFGFDGNVAYVTSSGSLRTGEAGHSLPGTSPVTMNAGLFYEAYGLKLRFASQYIAHSLYQVGGDRSTDQFEDSRFTLDWTSSYDFTDNVTAYFNVKNITNAPLRIFLGAPNWVIQREFYDQTFEGGVRLKL